MIDRFYHPQAWDSRVTLDETEATHLYRVLRKQPGDEVELFNGRGEACRATVVSVEKKQVQLEPKRVRIDETGPSGVTLALAPPKGDRFRWVIEKATELGVDEIVPLLTERTVVEPRGGKLEKLRQTVIAACKQSGRNRLLEIAPPVDLNTFLKQRPQPSLMLFGDLEGRPMAKFVDVSAVDTVCGIIGPEGGLTPGEQERLSDQGAQAISLAPHILRVETAAIAMAALLITRELG